MHNKFNVLIILVALSGCQTHQEVPSAQGKSAGVVDKCEQARINFGESQADMEANPKTFDAVKFLNSATELCGAQKDEVGKPIPQADVDRALAENKAARTNKSTEPSTSAKRGTLAKDDK